MSMLVPLLVPLFSGMSPLGIWSALGTFVNTIMMPLYWAVSGMLVGFHHLWSYVLPAGSGWTWALSILTLTVAIRVILIPLFVRQIHSSRNMQLLAPQIKELQRKYGSDRERLGQETMKLYREAGVNPMASCLPLILQMPIFYALFHVLSRASNGIATGSWLQNNQPLVDSLSNATIFSAHISSKFWPPVPFGSVQLLTIIMIIAMTVTLFITQFQLTRKNMPAEALTGPMAQQQKMMLFLFPVIFAVGGVNFPVGVLIYWLTSNLWTMGQQFYVIRRNPAPNTPAYAAWEARQRARGREPKKLELPTRGGGGARAGGNRSTPAVATDGGPATATAVDAGKPTGQQPVRQPSRQPSRQQPRKQARSKRKN